jgi:hypothetical protein
MREKSKSEEKRKAWEGVRDGGDDRRRDEWKFGDRRNTSLLTCALTPPAEMMAGSFNAAPSAGAPGIPPAAAVPIPVK